MPLWTRPHRPPRPHAARVALSHSERGDRDGGSHGEPPQLALRDPGRRREPGAGEGPPARGASVLPPSVSVATSLSMLGGGVSVLGGRRIDDRGRRQHAGGGVSVLGEEPAPPLSTPPREDLLRPSSSATGLPQALPSLGGLSSLPGHPPRPPTPCGAPTDPGSATGAEVVRGRAHDPAAGGL
nr:basic salivary proline-rich protein 3-like [Penaeus vannamei]